MGLSALLLLKIALTLSNNNDSNFRLKGCHDFVYYWLVFFTHNWVGKFTKKELDKPLGR